MATVLIVEDQPDVLILAESVLQHSGFETISASTIAEAETIIESNTPIDAVATVIGLGDEQEGGLKVAQLAAEKHPSIPILYVSDRPRTDGMEALFVEPSAFLPKPYTDEQLVAGISGLLRKPRPKPPSAAERAPPP